MKYDYYKVTIPGDAFDTIERAGQAAIDEARERARIFALPAEWTATRTKGDLDSWEIEFCVRRKRN